MSISADSTPFSEDGELVCAHLAGDADAFPKLYDRYYPDLLAYIARRVRDHARAEDLAQETLVRAYVKAHTIDPTRPLWPWLATVARRLVGHEVGRLAGEVLSDDLTAEPVGDDTADTYNERCALAQSLAMIPQRQRHALVARYVEDRSPAEVAASLGLTRGAFEQLLWRARRNLARAYGGPSLRERTGLALLPVLLRFRRFVVAADARVSSVTQATMPIAANVAVGTAVVLAGFTLHGAAPRADVPPAAAAPVAPRVVAPRERVEGADVRDPLLRLPRGATATATAGAAPAEPRATPPVAAKPVQPKTVAPTVPPAPTQAPDGEGRVVPGRDVALPKPHQPTPAPEPTPDSSTGIVIDPPGGAGGDTTVSATPPPEHDDPQHAIGVTVDTTPLIGQPVSVGVQGAGGDGDVDCTRLTPTLCD